MIKGIIFDWGGVIIDWTNDIIYRYISKRFNIDFAYTKKKLKYELLKKLYAGKIDEKEMWRRFFSSLNMELPDDYETLWIAKLEELCKINEGVMAIVKKLKQKGYKLAILSNNERSHAIWGKKIGSFQHFDIQVNSFEVHIIKPDERIYKLTLEKMGLKGEECVFIDDKEENLSPARKLGIHAIHFKNAEQLRKDLSKVLEHGI